MQEILSQLSDITKAFGLDAALYGVALVLALLMRFCRAYWRWCNGAHTLLAGVVMGLGGAALVLTIEAHPWQMIVLQGLTLAAVVLLGERILRSQSGKLGLPADNEWVKPKEKSDAV